MPFGKLRAIRSKNERDMRIFRTFKSQRLQNKYLSLRIRYVVLSANNMRDSHFMIINDDRKMVQRLIKISCNYEIFQLCRIERYFTAYEISKAHCSIRIFKTHHPPAP